MYGKSYECKEILISEGKGQGFVGKLSKKDNKFEQGRM
jgi:hypothetical protein